MLKGKSIFNSTHAILCDYKCSVSAHFSGGVMSLPQCLKIRMHLPLGIYHSWLLHLPGFSRVPLLFV